MTKELLDATYEEIDLIKDLDCYKKLVHVNELIKVELKDLIKDFNETKKLYEIESENKYSTKYLELSDKLSNLLIEINKHPLVIEYHEYEKEVNKYLDNLKKEMIKAVRGE